MSEHKLPNVIRQEKYSDASPGQDVKNGLSARPQKEGRRIVLWYVEPEHEERKKLKGFLNILN